jgi:hypothetical protein
MAKFDIDSLARLGALHRLEAIRAEIAALSAAFPDLTASGGGGGHLPGPFATGGRRRRSRRRSRARTAAPIAGAPARAGMSAAGRRRIAAAQRRRWAAWRKAQK